MTTATKPNDTTAAEMVIKRTFAAPRDKVFRAYTEGDRFARWWGAPGFELDMKAFDASPGGKTHYLMTNRAGSEMWGLFQYEEVSPVDRLVFVTSFSDADGNVARAPFTDLFPLKIRNVVEFAEQDGQTTIINTSNPIDASPEELAFFADFQKSVRAGTESTFKQLDQYLDESEREMVIKRVIDAPREKVFAAFTDAKHIGNWWGPRGFTTTTESMDVRPGGSWTYIMHGPDGAEYPNYVAYQEVTAPARLVYDQGIGGENPPAFQAMIDFTEVGDGTEIAMRALFPTSEALQHVKDVYGAEQGGHETLARLAEHLQER